MQHIKAWFEKHRAKIEENYFHFLRFPSISAESGHKKDLLACADWLVHFLKEGGITSKLLPTLSYPIVYAEDLSAGASRPTVLIYGHYDVQPVDPLELWDSPPFEPTLRDGKVYARGAVDDKGQIFYACLAVLCLKELKGKLPVNVKFCIEGEEESSSMGLSTALPSLKQQLVADALLIVDFGSSEGGVPAISLGARGLSSLEVSLVGSKTDLHSGIYGGLAYNPNRALAELLASLWDRNGKVAVPGFYDDVVMPSKEELKQYSFQESEKNLKQEAGIHAFGNEKGRSLEEANWFLPTLEINGMFGGYTGAGTKTVIPAKATAKITCRLVMNQDPQKVCRAIERFLKERAVKGMEVEISLHGGVRGFRGSPDTPLASAVRKAATEVVGKECINILSGASIPIGAAMMQALQIPVVGMGYGLPSDDIHAPNEHFDMERFEKGFLTVARALEVL